MGMASTGSGREVGWLCNRADANTCALAAKGDGRRSDGAKKSSKNPNNLFFHEDDAFVCMKKGVF
jgi:hypothetical protein